MVETSAAYNDDKPTQRMTVAEFLAWSTSRPGRYELVYGDVFVMQAERRRHAKVKFAVQTALVKSLQATQSPGEMLPDGMAVRIEREDCWLQPDALVHCNSTVDLDAVEIADPVVVVDVLSPSTQSFDMSYKLSGYFSVPSVIHYRVENPIKMPMIHHARQADGTILTRFASEGGIKLDPPGIELFVDGLLD